MVILQNTQQVSKDSKVITTNNPLINPVFTLPKLVTNEFFANIDYVRYFGITTEERDKMEVQLSKKFNTKRISSRSKMLEHIYYDRELSFIEKMIMARRF